MLILKDYLNYINENYPIRRSDAEKEAFRNYVLNEADVSDYTVYIETRKKHNNIVIGDISTAKLIFTAHYDTPATSLIPNVMLPKNKYLRIISHFVLPTILSVLSYIIGYILANQIAKILFVKIFLWIFFWVGLFAISFFLLTRCFENKHNKNDNTSGVATVLSLVECCSSKDVAFVLFDNEEKGYLGSKAFKEMHNEILKDKLIINFDCVGVGNNVLFVVKQGAKSHRLFNNLVENMKSNDDFNVMVYPFGEAVSNSDYKVFDCGIGVMTCKKKNRIFYTSKIHTNKDTEAYTENIDFLVCNMVRFVNENL